jgi:NadR type nicotinamide-nucleotide adenylyltransferase
MAADAKRVRRICLHGPESTGKSTLATRLAAHFGCEVVPEYGRAYCETHGTDIDMAALVHIAERQQAMNAAAVRRATDSGTKWVLFDTDPLLTAVWAKMMFGNSDLWFAGFNDYADHYLLLDIDLPFIDDGLRVYRKADDRRHFFELAKAELDARGVTYSLIRGAGDARLAHALAAVDHRCGVHC